MNQYQFETLRRENLRKKREATKAVVGEVLAVAGIFVLAVAIFVII
jgi:hypothetical protein